MEILTNAPDSKNLRIQTAMVVYELEQALGKYVLDNESDSKNFPAGTVEAIARREFDKGRSLDTSYVRNIVEATYLDEVFGLALHIAGESQEYELLAQLKQLCASLDVYTIRNAVSHPNRQFPECYWHRVAAIATDPLVSQLRLSTVTSIFRAAERGQLHSPPDEWVDQARWSVPNNLPKSFDHSITGLIGRRKEVAQVVKALKNPKSPLIAIIAPGGRGKTALLLEVLEKTSLDPESAEWLDEIFYLSFKTEVLKHDGIQKLDTPTEPTTFELQSAIAKEMSIRHHSSEPLTFEDTLKNHENSRLLLCLDNLDTFLRDSPDEFRDFYLSLPANWRVIVTSRVTVDMAMTITLQHLDKSGAEGLAQQYLSRRGGKLSSKDALDLIVERCQHNPLAIRLTIDSYLAGKPLQDAVTTVNEEILKFSFTNLIDALSQNAMAVLECLFVLGEPARRVELCLLLDLDRDQVAESFEELLRTSLVSRYQSANEENIDLSSSIRDLLLLNPLDLQLRGEVTDRVVRRKAILTSQRVEQRRQEKNPLDWDYIPEDSPDHAKQLAIKAYNVLRKGIKVQIQGLLADIQRTFEADPRDPLINRVLGHLLITLGDHVRGKQYLFDSATKLSPKDPAAAYDLASRLLESQDLQEAHNLSKWLIDEGWTDIDRSNVDCVRNIYRVYWLSLMWLGVTEKVIEETKAWRDTGELEILSGSIHASALRRAVENKPSEIADESLLEALHTMKALFDLEGVAGVSAYEGIKLIEDIVRRIRFGISQLLAHEASHFADNYLLAMVNVHRDYSEDDPEIAKWITALATCDCGNNPNPLHKEIWSRFLEEGIYVENKEYDLISKGYEIVTIYHKPIKLNRPVTFLFGKNESSEEFYLNRDQFTGSDMAWSKLNIGDRLAIIRGSVLDREKAIPVREAMIIQ